MKRSKSRTRRSRKAKKSRTRRRPGRPRGSKNSSRKKRSSKKRRSRSRKRSSKKRRSSKKEITKTKQKLFEQIENPGNISFPSKIKLFRNRVDKVIKTEDENLIRDVILIENKYHERGEMANMLLKNAIKMNRDDIVMLIVKLAEKHYINIPNSFAIEYALNNNNYKLAKFFTLREKSISRDFWGNIKHRISTSNRERIYPMIEKLIKLRQRKDKK